MALTGARPEGSIRPGRDRWWISVLLVTVLLGACSEGSGSPEDVAAQYPNASEYQLELLADGVTWAEYEKATVDLVECMEEQGVPTVGPYQSGSVLNYEFGSMAANASEAESDRVMQIHNECYDEHLSVVRFAYLDSIAPSEEEAAEIQRKRRECARELGFDTPDDMPDGDYYDLVAEHADELRICTEKNPYYPAP